MSAGAGDAIRRIAPTLLVGWLCASGCGLHEEPPASALSVELRPTRTEFVYQESPDLDFSLVNESDDAIDLAQPDRSDALPNARIVSIVTGEQWLRRSLPGPTPSPTQRLAPGARVDWSVPLDACCRLPGPGEYDLSLLYPFDGTEEAESAPVRIHALPSTAANLAVASLRGAPGPMLNGAWVNVAGPTARLMRGTLSLAGEHPRLSDVKALVDVPPDTHPVLSAPPNGLVSPDHWIAWTEGAKLRALQYGEQTGASPVLEIALAGSGEATGSELVAPLHGDPLVDPSQRPDGAALLWQDGPDGGRWQVIALRASGLTPGASADEPGPRPIWVESFTDHSGHRTIAMLQRAAGRLRLETAPWPGETGSRRTLAEWDSAELGEASTFIAAGAALDPEDSIQGAILLGDERAGDEPVAISVLRWTLDVHGGWKDRGRETLVWPSRTGPDWALIAVSRAGADAIVLRDEAGRYFSYRGGMELRPADASLGGERTPLAVVFQSDYDPLLLATEPTFGVQIVAVDGAPLPSDSGPGDEPLP